MKRMVKQHVGTIALKKLTLEDEKGHDSALIDTMIRHICTRIIAGSAQKGTIEALDRSLLSPSRRPKTHT